MGLLTASALTAVGLTRQSMGPAISVRLAGVAGCASSAISAVAASAATQGWQMATRCEPGPIAARKSIRCSMYSSSPKRPAASGTSRALCQSVTWTSWSASIVRAVSRSSVAKWPDIGATSSTRGCGVATSFLKCSSVPNGVTCAASSVTATSRLPDRMLWMPNGGRLCVSPARAINS
jgi:hypothetical protein